MTVVGTCWRKRLLLLKMSRLNWFASTWIIECSRSAKKYLVSARTVGGSSRLGPLNNVCTVIRHGTPSNALLAQQFRQPDLRIAARCCGRLRPTLGIALIMLRTSTTPLHAWAAGKFACAAHGGVWAVVESNSVSSARCIGRLAVAARAFADTLSAGSSLPVHARVQHPSQADASGAAF